MAREKSWNWVACAAGRFSLAGAVRLRLSTAALRVKGLSRMGSLPIVWPVLNREFMGRPAAQVCLDGVDEVVDFLVNERPVLPNGLLWSGLKRMSDAWHEEVLSREKGENIPFPALPWPEGLAGSIQAESVRDLTSSHELWEEGRSMHHCVFDRNEDCQHGTYWALSISVNGKRHTVGLICGPSGRWSVEQVQRVCNANATPAARKVAQALCRMMPNGPLGEQSAAMKSPPSGVDAAPLDQAPDGLFGCGVLERGAGLALPFRVPSVDAHLLRPIEDPMGCMELPF
jgi:hypothetical protein